MDQRARHSRYSRNPFRAGHVFGATLVRNCYGLSGCSPPSTDLTGLPANGGFYFQAFSGSVDLPAAGYNYKSVWTPLLAGLAPAGMAASLAALAHSALTLSMLRRRNWRKPLACLIWPKTGSTICFRNRYRLRWPARLSFVLILAMSVPDLSFLLVVAALVPCFCRPVAT